MCQTPPRQRPHKPCRRATLQQPLKVRALSLLRCTARVQMNPKCPVLADPPKNTAVRQTKLKSRRPIITKKVITSLLQMKKNEGADLMIKSFPYRNPPLQWAGRRKRGPERNQNRIGHARSNLESLPALRPHRPLFGTRCSVPASGESGFRHSAKLGRKH